MTHLRAACLIGLFAVPAPAAELRTLAGDKLVGELVRISPDGVVLKTEAGEQTTALRQMLWLSLSPTTPKIPVAAHTDVELVDGTRLHCSDFSIVGKTVNLKLFEPRPGSPAELAVPLGNVFLIVRDAGKTAARSDWKQLISDRNNRDVLVFRREERLDGLPGTAIQGSEDGSTLTFRLAAGSNRDIQLARLQGLIFSQPARDVIKPTLCKVIDADGNTYVATSVGYSEGKLSVETVSGVKAEFTQTDPLTKLDFSQGNLTYLSDLDPSEATLNSVVEFGTGYRFDANLDGGPLKLGGETYAKGLSVHPRAVLAFDTRGQYKEFRVILGVDDSVVTESHVRVKIETDGEAVYETEVRREDEPKPLALNVQGVDRIRITVESVRPFDLNSQVDLADAKFTK